MNKITALLPVTLCLALSGCMSTETTTTKVGKNRGVVTQSVNAAGDTIEVVKSLSCPKPVAKVSIAPLKCKAAKCSNVPQATGNHLNHEHQERPPVNAATVLQLWPQG